MVESGAVDPTTPVPEPVFVRERVYVDATLVPDNATEVVVAVPAELDDRLNVADFVPAMSGEKVICMVQLAPGVKVVLEQLSFDFVN